MRVYELAKLLDMNNKELMTLLDKMHITVKSHMSTLDDDTVDRVEKEIEKQKKPASPAEAPADKKKAEPLKISHKCCVKDLADALGISAGEAVKKLMAAGMMAPASTALNDDILLALSDACGVDIDWSDSVEEEKKPAEPQTGKKASLRGNNLQPRPPIVTVMGHVDHGKTSLLDAIRKTNVTSREAGGITQHIGASHVTYNGQQIVFLDTPGHAAFTSMRARGAQCTDIAVLVVAADDGVMPQTIEAINHAKAAGVEIIVAINKIDKPTANPQQVMQELSGYGLVAESWGGDTVMVEVSAKTGLGIDDLLENILIVAEMAELKADPTVSPDGVVIEARLDKGQGAVASVIVQQGTLRTGNIIQFDTCWGKVRAMFNDQGKSVKQAGPSTAVELIGLNGVPQPGEHFHQVKTEKEARDYFAALEAEQRNAQTANAVKRMTLEDLMNQTESGAVPTLNLVIKSDVQGTIEAIVGSLEKLNSDLVKINIVHAGVGRISESDIMLATASNAIVVGFNVRPENSASKLAEKEKIQIRLYSIIYEILDDVKAAMEGLLQPEVKEKLQGEAEIRRIFNHPKFGKIAGCRVTKGIIRRDSKVRLIRDGIVIWDGSVASLRHEKDEASEIREGFECGLTLTNYRDFRESDVLEAYELVEEKRTL